MIYKAGEKNSGTIEGPKVGVGPSLNFQNRAELEPRPVEPEPSLELIFEKNFEPEPSFEPKYLEPSPSRAFEPKNGKIFPKF